MVTFLISSILVLGLIAIAIYYWQKPANTSETIELPPPQPQIRGLFSDLSVNETRPVALNRVPEITHQIDREDFEDALAAIRAFQQTPDRTSTTKLLHVAAQT